MTLNSVNTEKNVVPDSNGMSVSDSVGVHGTSIGLVIMEVGMHFKSGKAVATGAAVSLGSLILSQFLDRRGR